MALLRKLRRGAKGRRGARPGARAPSQTTEEQVSREARTADPSPPEGGRVDEPGREPGPRPPDPERTPQRGAGAEGASRSDDSTRPASDGDDRSAESLRTDGGQTDAGPADAHGGDATSRHADPDHPDHQATRPSDAGQDESSPEQGDGADPAAGRDEPTATWGGPAGPAHPREGGLGATLKRAVFEFKEDNLADRAAGLTYYSVLSIFPALIALVSIVGLVWDPETVTETLTNIAESLGSSSAADTFEGPIDDVTSSQGTVGVLLIVGIVGALWTASGYIGAFMRASNEIYEVEEGRTFFKLRPLQMLITLILVVLLALVLAAVTLTGPVAEEIGDQIGLSSTALTIWDIAKWPVLAVVVLFMLALLYHMAPNAKLPRFRWITLGSILAVVVWLVASAGFAFFVANFGSYNKTYGALAGVIIALVWLWITNLAILLGAEIDAERERSRQLERGVPGAERRLQLDERSTPKKKRRARTG